MLNFLKNSLHFKCFVLCVASIHTGSAMEETLEKPSAPPMYEELPTARAMEETIAEPSAPPMYEELPPAYDDLYQANESELLRINDNWNAQDIDTLLDEMERTLNEGGDLEKYLHPITWMNKPVTTIKQLDRVVILQHSRFNAILPITDIRLCATESSLTEYQIQFLANLPHIRLFHLTCKNSNQEIIPLLDSLAQRRLVDLNLSSSSENDYAKLSVKNNTHLHSFHLSGCNHVPDDMLKRYINSLPDTIEQLTLKDASLSESILLEAIPRFRGLKVLKICHYNQLSSSAIDIVLKLLPEAMEELDLSGTQLSYESLEQIAQFQGLKRLRLCNWSLSASSLERFLVNLPDIIEELDLSATDVLDFSETDLIGKGLEQIARFQRLKKLNLSYCMSLGSSSLEKLLTSLPDNLEELDLSDTYLTFEGLLQIAHCHGLKRLVIRRCPFLASEVINSILWKLPEGLTLKYGYDTTITIQKNNLIPPKIVSLNNSKLSSANLNKYFAFLPDNLEELDLAETNLTDEGLKQIARFQRLKRLNLCDCKSLSGSGLENLLANLPEGIEELYLTNTHLTDAGLNHIARFQRLKRLSLKLCTSLSAPALENLLARLPVTIEKLYLSETNLTDKGLKQIARFQRLKGLYICGCTSLSGSAVKKILWKMPEGIEVTDVNWKTRTIDKRMQESPRKEGDCSCTVL